MSARLAPHALAWAARTGRRAASIALARTLRYEAGLPVLRRLCRWPLLQRTVLAPRARHLARLDGIGGPQADAALARTRFLLKSLGRRWQIIDLGRLGRQPPGASVPWLSVLGLEHFDEACRRGPVVLLSSHFGATRVGPLFVARLGHRVLSIEASDQEYAGVDAALASRIRVEALLGPDAFPARAALAARRRLREGGVVHTTGDGLLGRADVRLPFCGAMREFRSTFASMALDTGAAVVPVFAPVAETGRVSLEFLAPLDPGPPTMSREDRLDAMVRQYVVELERRWRSDPGNVDVTLWNS